MPITLMLNRKTVDYIITELYRNITLVHEKRPEDSIESILRRARRRTIRILKTRLQIPMDK